LSWTVAATLAGASAALAGRGPLTIAALALLLIATVLAAAVTRAMSRSLACPAES
jgi:hypothetical protein